MPSTTLVCPACQFERTVEINSIPVNTKRATCPKCRQVFHFLHPKSPDNSFNASPEMDFTFEELPDADAIGDIRKPKNYILALVLIFVFITLLGGRLYFSDKALNIPSPNFIAASEHGIATQWADQVLVTDHEGVLVSQIVIPENIIPTQMIWVNDEIWVADYRSHNIFILTATGEQQWLELHNSSIKGHFKVVPDLDNQRIFVSAGHAIRVFDDEGNFEAVFGKEGRLPGELKFPNQFLMDEDGHLVIANTKSPAIDKFAADGTFLTRLVRPTGHTKYRYPTNVVLPPDRIVTLEADGYLQDARLAVYDRQGKYIGQHERIPGFRLIGDIDTWGDRVFASDMENSRVYAFSAKDLSYLGEYSADLKELGEGYRKDSRNWSRLSTLALIGMLSLLVPIVYFYVVFRRSRFSTTNIHQTEGVKTQTMAAGTTIKKVPLKKSSVSYPKAALLSVVMPGLGQFYKRHIIRGALFLVGIVPIVLLIAITAEPAYVGSIDWNLTSYLGMLQSISIGLVIYIVNIWDAYRSVKS